MANYLGMINSATYGVQLPIMAPVLALDLAAADAVALDADGILNDKATSTTVTTTATVFLKQPPQARGLSFTPSAAADVGNIVVAGTNIKGHPITDTIATDGANAVLSTKAFKTITSIVFPIDDAPVSWDVGWDARIGLNLTLAEKPLYFEIFNNVIELATSGVMVVDSDEVEKNTYDPQGAIDGLKPLKLLLFL